MLFALPCSCLTFPHHSTTRQVAVTRPPPPALFSPYMVDLQRKLNNLVVDDSASLYAVGTHTTQFKATTWTSATTNTTVTYLYRGGGNDVWVQKVDPAGRVLWITAFGSSGNDEGRSVAVDSQGNVLVAGFFTYNASYANPMRIGSTTLNAATSPAGTASTDIFVAKLNGTNGTVLWARQFGGEGTDVVVSLDATGSGGVVVAGTFNSSSLTLDAVTLTNPGTGNVTFAATLGPNGVVASAGVYPELNGLSKMVVDHATDAVYLIGTDYVARLGSWTTPLVGSSLSETRRGLAIDPSSRYVFVGGNFQGASITMGETTLRNPNTNMDSYVARLDAATGRIEWAVRAGGDSGDTLQALVVDASAVYIAGTCLLNINIQLSIYCCKQGWRIYI